MGSCNYSYRSDGTKVARKSSYSDIPQSWIDRVNQYNPDADLSRIARQWRERKAEAERKSVFASDIKLGDVISADRQIIDDSANLKNKDQHAYWNVKKSDGTTVKYALDGRAFTVEKVEKRKDGVKITAKYDIGADLRQQAKPYTVTRVVKDDDRFRKYKK